MPKEPNSPEQKTQTNEEHLLAEAMRFFERLNENARHAPCPPPFEKEALASLASFQETARRLEVLPAK